MRTIERTVYTFDELSDHAKSRAANWFRESSAQDFADFSAESVLDDAARICRLFGLEISTKPVRLLNGTTRYDPNVYWSVGDCSAGASYAGSYRYQKGGWAAVLKECPPIYDGKEQASNAEICRIARDLGEIQRRYFYQITADISHGRNVYSRSSVDVSAWADESRVTDDDRAAVAELLADVASWIHRSLETEWEYRQSDDAIAVCIRANEYTFDEHGKREG